MDKPYVLNETEDFAVIFKPPKMHCVPGKKNIYHEGAEGEEGRFFTLCDFVQLCGLNYFDIMHRLDYETNGLVLFAKNEKSYNFFKTAQDNGEFIKEYSAIVNNEELGIRNFKLPDGFPEYKNENPNLIESYFRPFGPGRKLVRPVIEDGKKHKEIAKDKDGFYRTEIIKKEENVLTIQIKRGFRHQIRCHLCWIGMPILNDPLYSLNNEPVSADDVLMLRSHALYFPCPVSGERLEYRVGELK